MQRTSTLKETLKYVKDSFLNEPMGLDGTVQIQTSDVVNELPESWIMFKTVCGLSPFDTLCGTDNYIPKYDSFTLLSPPFLERLHHFLALKSAKYAGENKEDRVHQLDYLQMNIRDLHASISHPDYINAINRTSNKVVTVEIEIQFLLKLFAYFATFVTVYNYACAEIHNKSKVKLNTIELATVRHKLSRFLTTHRRRSNVGLRLSTDPGQQTKKRITKRPSLEEGEINEDELDMWSGINELESEPNGTRRRRHNVERRKSSSEQSTY